MPRVEEIEGNELQQLPRGGGQLVPVGREEKELSGYTIQSVNDIYDHLKRDACEDGPTPEDLQVQVLAQDAVRVLKDRKDMGKYLTKLEKIAMKLARQDTRQGREQARYIIALRGLLIKADLAFTLADPNRKGRESLRMARREQFVDISLALTTAGGLTTGFAYLTDPMAVVAGSLRNLGVEMSGAQVCSMSTGSGTLSTLWNSACGMTQTILRGTGALASSAGTTAETSRIGALIMFGVLIFLLSMLFFRMTRAKMFKIGLVGMQFRSRKRRSARKSKRKSRRKSAGKSKRKSRRKSARKSKRKSRRKSARKSKRKSRRKSARKSKRKSR